MEFKIKVNVSKSYRFLQKRLDLPKKCFINKPLLARGKIQERTEKTVKALNQFRRFDFPAFSSGKDFCVTGVEPWLDFETKKPLGYKVLTVITRDQTPYASKDGQVVSNLY